MKDMVRMAAAVSAMSADPLMGHSRDVVDMHERYIKRKPSGKDRSKIKAARKQRRKKR